MGSRIRNFYAYLYIDPRDDTVFYVGKGKDYRAWAHLKKSAPNIILRNKITQLRLLGLAPEILILHAVDEAQAFDMERELIAYFGRRDLGTGSLVNYTDGGDGVSGRTGMRHTPETKAHLSEVMKRRGFTPEHRAKITEASRNRTFSDLARARWAESRRDPAGHAKRSESAKRTITPERLAEMTARAALVNKGTKRSPEAVAKGIETARIRREAKRAARS